MSILWYQNGFSMVANFAWLSGEGGRLVLTDDMRNVAVKVVESIIRDPDMSRRH